MAKKPAKRAKKPEPRKLTDKQGAFALEYVVDFNGTRAAIAAGFSAKTASVQAYQLLQNPLVAAEVARLQEEKAKRLKMDADQLLTRLLQEVHADIADIHYEDDTLKPIREWPLVWRTGLVAGLEIEETYEKEEEPDEMEPQGHGGALRRPKAARKASGRVAKLKFSDRVRRLELIGRHQNIQAWKDRKVLDVADPMKKLFEQIAGQAIRPGGGV